VYARLQHGYHAAVNCVDLCSVAFAFENYVTLSILLSSRVFQSRLFLVPRFQCPQRIKPENTGKPIKCHIQTAGCAGTGITVMIGGVAAIVDGVVALGIAATAPVSIPVITAVGAVTAVSGGVAACAGGAVSE